MQIEIIKYLNKMKEPLGIAEIAIALKVDKVKISKAIRQLLKYNEVIAIEIDRFEAMKRSKAKRRMRLYYVEK